MSNEMKHDEKVPEAEHTELSNEDLGKVAGGAEKSGSTEKNKCE
jgi:hypothetical protein